MEHLKEALLFSKNLVAARKRNNHVASVKEDYCEELIRITGLKMAIKKINKLIKQHEKQT